MNSQRTSVRTRLIAAAIIVAGITGATLAFTGIASASTASSAAPQLAATSGPVTVINAVQDPSGARTAMGLFDDATNKSFTPTADPTFNNTGWIAAPGGTAEENNAPVGGSLEPEEYSVTNASNSSWSLGGSIGTKMGGGIGFAEASVSLKLSASHSWGTTTADTVTIDAEVEPGQVVWVEEAQSNATYTGTYSFTANGINYQVTNVTITTPASKDTNDPLTAVTYRIVQEPISQVAQAVGAAQNTFNAHQLTPAQLTMLGNKLGLNR